MTADTGLFHVALRNPMRTSSAVKPDSSITADNHFHTARNSLKLRDSICPPYREFFDEEKIHSVQVDMSRIAACGADEELGRIRCGPVAAALQVAVQGRLTGAFTHEMPLAKHPATD
jgi:hypothetical protein